jgi:hypothetical protein
LMAALKKSLGRSRFDFDAVSSQALRPRPRVTFL